jgi:hypothetical protein
MGTLLLREVLICWNEWTEELSPTKNGMVYSESREKHVQIKPSFTGIK